MPAGAIAGTYGMTWLPRFRLTCRARARSQSIVGFQQVRRSLPATSHIGCRTKCVDYPRALTSGAAFSVAGVPAGVVGVCVAPTFMPVTAGGVYTPPAEPAPEPANTLPACPPESLDTMESATIEAAAVKPNTAPNRLPCLKNDIC